MSRRIRSIMCQGAASALFVVAGPTFADPADESASLPQWMLRAQQRLALKPAQQRGLRTLVDENSVKVQAVSGRASHEHVEALRREFRVGLADILSPEQLAEWDALLEELLGAVHLHHAPLLARRSH